MKNTRFPSILASLSVAVLTLGIAGCGGDDNAVTHPPDASTDVGQADTIAPSADTGAMDSATGDTGTADTGAADTGADAGPTTTLYVAALDGNQEVPPIATTATGMGTFTLSADKKSLAYHVTQNVTGGIEAHIHIGAGGEENGLLYPLVPFSADMTGTLSLSAMDVANLEQGLLYVNVHTNAHINGEIRGQILKPGDTLYVATLTGNQEVPAVVSAGTGDAAVILDAAKTGIKYHLKTSLTPINAHIHNAIGSISGQVVYPLMPLGSTIDGSTAVTATEAGDLAAGHWYANVHTTAHPGGEIRGQILLPGQILYTAAMSPNNEVPPAVNSPATGGAQFILDPDKTTLHYEVVVNGVTATAVQIESGNGSMPTLVFALTLAPPGAKGTQTIGAGDVTALDASSYYCNVLTSAFPKGAMRGTITKQ